MQMRRRCGDADATTVRDTDAMTLRDADVTTVRDADATTVRDTDATTVRDADATTVQDATVQEDTVTPYEFDTDCAVFENSTSENSSEGWETP